MKPTPQPKPGDVIAGRYRILRLLGRGSTGSVYEASHIEIGARLAIKVVNPKSATYPEMAQRLQREARSAAALNHPNIVRVTDFGRDNEQPYLVMELLEGETLTETLKQQHLGLADRIHLMLQMLRGLEHAHSKGVIHRDLKPDNLFLVDTSEGVILKILDFGLAKQTIRKDVTLTIEGMVSGTPRYMSPEQADGHPGDYRSDIYSAGIILYELLSGSPPFTDLSITRVLHQHLCTPPPPLVINEADETIDSAKLKSIVHKAIEKKPEDRFSSVSVFSAELLECLNFNPALRSSSYISYSEQKQYGYWGWAAAAAIAIVLGTTIGILVVPPSQPSKNQGKQIQKKAQREAPYLIDQRSTYDLRRKEGIDAINSALDSRHIARAEGALTDLLELLDTNDSFRNALLPLYRGHIAVLKGDYHQTAKEYTEAIRRDTVVLGDARLLKSLPNIVTDHKIDIAPLVEASVINPGKNSVEALLLFANRSLSFRLRRLAYEALEKLNETPRLNPSEYLRRELRSNGTDRCEIRNWYITRLLNLANTAEAKIALEEEQERQITREFKRVELCLFERIEKVLEQPAAKQPSTGLPLDWYE